MTKYEYSQRNFQTKLCYIDRKRTPPTPPAQWQVWAKHYAAQAEVLWWAWWHELISLTAEWQHQPRLSRQTWLTLALVGLVSSGVGVALAYLEFISTHTTF